MDEHEDDDYEDDITLIMRTLNDAMIRIEHLEEKMSAQTEVNIGLGRAISIVNGTEFMEMPPGQGLHVDGIPRSQRLSEHD